MQFWPKSILWTHQRLLQIGNWICRRSLNLNRSLQRTTFKLTHTGSVSKQQNQNSKPQLMICNLCTLKFKAIYFETESFCKQAVGGGFWGNTRLDNVIQSPRRSFVDSHSHCSHFPELHQPLKPAAKKEKSKTNRFFFCWSIRELNRKSVFHFWSFFQSYVTWIALISQQIKIIEGNIPPIQRSGRWR